MVIFHSFLLVHQAGYFPWDFPWPQVVFWRTEAADLPRNGRTGAGHLDQQFAHHRADGLQDGPGGTQPPGITRLIFRDDPGFSIKQALYRKLYLN